jgi:hypothetical protein
MSKKMALATVFAATLGAGIPGVSHAATYSLNVASNGSIHASPVGTVNITDTGSTLTYQFNMTSGTLSTVYMDVSGNVSSMTDGFGNSDIGSSTTALGTFADTVKLPLLDSNATELTVTFTGSDLAANYTLLDGDIQMFSAANTSNGLVGDTPVVTPLPATLPLFAGGLGAVGFLSRGRKRKKAAALAA